MRILVSKAAKIGTKDGVANTMSRVLVSFLGTSRIEKKEAGYRQYLQANYKFDNGDSYESPFIAVALKRHYNIDKLILVGTPKSMWEEVYHAFTGEIDDVYAELGDFCENATKDTPLESLPHKDKIEKALGNGSKIVLVRYGLNRDEISHNSESVLSIEKLLQSGDELYLDITHSFRSLPLLLMNSLLFMKSASVKNIAIRSISYGMLDITRELGYTPVVELNSILDLNDWIAGASEFKAFGNAYKVAALMGRTGCAKDADVARVLTEFSDAMNLNYISEIRKKLDEVKLIKFEEISPFARFLIEPSIKQVVEKFKNTKYESQFQLCLAEYQFEQKHYAAAALCLAEAMVSLVAECAGLIVISKKDRELSKAVITGTAPHDMMKKYFAFYRAYLCEKKKVEESVLGEKANELQKEYRKAYVHLTGIRNGVAHTTEKRVDFEEVKCRLYKAMELVRPIVSFDKRVADA